MRKTIFALIPALALGLAACSQSAQDNLSNSLDAYFLKNDEEKV